MTTVFVNPDAPIDEVILEKGPNGEFKEMILVAKDGTRFAISRKWVNVGGGVRPAVHLHGQGGTFEGVDETLYI